MSKILVLYSYNKYYNRIIKKLNTYNEYKALITTSGSTPAALKGLEIESTNFNWEDGVFAKHVINIPRGSSSFFNYHEPDYLVLERTYKDGDVNVSEVSRWFVLETTKMLGNQLELSLRRDLLADYFDEVTNAPVFIEKGNPGINDPAIFNKESMTYNQIKKYEYKLDNTKLSGKGGGWVVGYLARESSPTDIGPCNGQAKIPNDVYEFGDLPNILQTLIDHDDSPMFQIKSDSFGMDVVARIKTAPPSHEGWIKVRITDPEDNSLTISSSIVDSQMYSNEISRGYPWFHNQGDQASPWTEEEAAETIRQAYINNRATYGFYNKINSYVNSLTGNGYFFTTDLAPYDGIIYHRNGRYYRLSIYQTETRITTPNYTISNIKSNANDLCSAYKSFCDSFLINGTTINENTNADNSSVGVVFFKPALSTGIVIEEVSYQALTATLDKNRNTNLDAPYDLFCIPIGEIDVKSSGTTILTNRINVALAIAQGIAVKAGTKLYDLQILPYCPFAEIINSDGDIDITGFDEHEDYDYIELSSDPTTKVGIIVYPKSCRGTFNLSLANPRAYLIPYVYEDLSSAIDKKVKSETNLVRFVSPNFSSTFDINVQKNKGITSLNVDYFYKPYSPYIHVAPYFSGLYGQDFDDPKGLICSGDFSIATAQSQWENYQIQNKNFELIFNRQIQNLDVNNSIAYDVQKITAGTGQATSLLTGVAGGAVAGSMIAPGIGTAVGAVVGGIAGAVTSGVGAKYDLEYLKKSQTEARSYAVDMYGYNLGNIKALPYALTRVGAFTENNKIFPFLEFYTSTDEEKETLRKKIKYNGMTIMRIGKIADFIQANYKYVQGQLIRLEGIDEDSHVIAEIAREIKEGAYYYGTDTIEP